MMVVSVAYKQRLVNGYYPKASLFSLLTLLWLEQLGY